MEKKREEEGTYMRRVIFLITLAGALAAMMALPGAAVAQSSVLDDL